jgi:RNA polymerase sigma-70 factor (ECF subfamily)
MNRTQVTASAREAPEESALVQRARQSPQAFAELYDQHMTSVYRYLLAKVGDVQDAEDLTSQTFMEALEHLGSYRGEGVFRAWLLRIARNKAADHFRRRRPLVALEEEADWVVDRSSETADSVETSAENHLQMALVARKLSTLSPDRAEAVALRIFGNLEVTDIARTMKKPEPAVRMLLHRGVRDLQAQLNPTPVEKAL